jgi:hypothetical protein
MKIDYNAVCWKDDCLVTKCPRCHKPDALLLEPTGIYLSVDSRLTQIPVGITVALRGECMECGIKDNGIIPITICKGTILGNELTAWIISTQYASVLFNNTDAELLRSLGIAHSTAPMS